MEKREEKEKLGRAVRELVDALNVRVEQAKELGLQIELRNPTKLKGFDPDEQTYQVRIYEEISY